MEQPSCHLILFVNYVPYWVHMQSDHDMNTVFQALAHSSRRRVLDLVKNRPGIGVGELASHFDVSRMTVMKHLAVLGDAELLISRKDGRTRRLYFNAVPIQMIHDRWSTEYSAYWSSTLTEIKYRVELPTPETKKRKAKK